MIKPIQHKIGIWLLISLLPSFIIFVVAVSLSNGDDPFVVAALGLFSFLYFLAALVLGPIFIVWSNVQANRAYRAAMQYAERHGWHPISRTSWRNRKRDNTSLSVSQSYGKRTFLLQIESEGETITIDEFESSLWALQFGDWLWGELLEVNAAPDRQVIEEKRAEWETTAVAVISTGSAPRSDLANRVSEVVSRPESTSTRASPPHTEYLHATPQPQRLTPRKDRATAAVLAILLGWIGAHKFYLGHVGLGIAFIAGSLLTWGIIPGLLGIAEGIIYLTKSDEEFQDIYVNERRAML